jgi:hypothetical protein
MDVLHLLHLVFICTWLGVVMAEGVIELNGATVAVAKLHFWIDLLLELPLLMAVLITGGMLLDGHWPPSPLLTFKIGSGLIAVFANILSVAIVVVRYSKRGDAIALDRYSRWVKISALGVPFGLIAAYMGFRNF